MKTVLVTGGARNLGATICTTLAHAGYSVVVHYKNSLKEAEKIVNECQKFGVQADCIQGDFSTIDSTQQFIDRYLKKFPQTTYLVNNVGNYLLGTSLQTSFEQWTDLFQTNLNAPYLLMRQLIPSIKQQKGSIINIGVSGLNFPYADVYSTVYTMTKAALLMLTKSLALELASDQVRVNMISPGYLETSIDLPSDLSHIPLKRLGTLREVADMVVYLLSEKANYITGQNIEIAGGNRL